MSGLHLHHCEEAGRETVKHTPGPWEADGLTVLVPRGIAPHVAHCCDSRGDGLTDQAEANARLIAAAPTLADALREAREVTARSIRFQIEVWKKPSEELATLLARIDAALKAAGCE